MKQMEGSRKIRWNALNHLKAERSSDWFWFVGITAGAIAILSIYFGNLLFGLLILIATFTIFIQANIEPHMVEFEINRKGIIADKTFYPYSTLESFWVVDEDGWDRDRILIKSQKTFMPLIIIPIGEEVQADEIREELLTYLDEEEMSEPSLQIVMNRLGF